MPPELIPDDEDYASSEDSDFAPDAVPAQAAEDSTDEESEPEEQAVAETKKKPKLAKRKRGQDEEAEDAGFENSGDEAIIEKGLKKQRRKKKGKDEEDDEGGEGGLVKTRSMRAQECVFPLIIFFLILTSDQKDREKTSSRHHSRHSWCRRPLGRDDIRQTQNQTSTCSTFSHWQKQISKSGDFEKSGGKWKEVS